MIELNLGLTEGQLRKSGRVGKSGAFQDTIADKATFPDVTDFFEKNLGDFQGQTNAQITTFFKKFTKREPFDNAFKLLQKEKGNTTFTQQIWNLRPAAASVADAIAATTIKGSVVQQIATQFNQIQAIFGTLRIIIKKAGPGVTAQLPIKKAKATLLVLMKKYNVFVVINRQGNKQIDTAKSLAAVKIIPKT